MKLFISVNAAASSTFSLGPSWVRTQNAPDVNVPPAHYTSDEAASHATITNEKLKNERVLFSAAPAFLGYDLFIQETGEIVPEMPIKMVPIQRALEGFG